MDKLMSRVQKHFHKDDNSNQQATTGQHLSAPNNLLRVSDHEFRSGPSSGDAGSGSPDFKVASVEELGDVQSLSTCVKRDLGFQGKLGDHVVLTYGDTMFSVPQGDNQFRGMTCNSCAIACNDATQVFDPILDENSYPRCLLPPDAAAGEDPSEYAVGITNIIETSHGNGMNSSSRQRSSNKFRYLVFPTQPPTKRKGSSTRSWSGNSDYRRISRVPGAESSSIV